MKDWKKITAMFAAVLLLSGALFWYMQEKGNYPRQLTVSSETGRDGKPSAPMNITLNATIISQDELEIIVEFSSLLDSPDTIANISLPPQFRLVEGELLWRGSLKKDGKAALRVKARAADYGEGVVEASTSSLGSGNVISYGRSIKLYVSATPKGITISKTPFILENPEPETGQVGAERVPDSETPQLPPTAAECSSDSDCGVGGCSGQVCTTAAKAKGIITTCEYREKYGCYKLTGCGCVNGKCSWKENAEFKACLEKSGQPQ